MKIKAPTFQSKARALQVFLCCKSSSSLPHHPYTSFSGTPGMSEVTTNRPCLLCSSHHVENPIGCDWGVQQSRNRMSRCHIAIKHFLHPQLQGPQMKGCRGGKLHICLIRSMCSLLSDVRRAFSNHLSNGQPPSRN